MVKATWEKISDHKARYEVEISVEEMERAVDQAYRKLVPRLNVPGFRKGKAPRVIVERMLGREALWEEAVEEAVAPAYDEAVAQSGLEPIGRPEVNVTKLAVDEPLVFTAEVDVKPEVQLGAYEGLEIERDEANVPDGEVEAQLQRLAEANAQLVPKAGEGVKAEAGDFVTIDFEGFLGDEPFAGGKGENYDLELGSGQFIPGFEDQLIGAEPGEERDVKVTFPEQYHAEHLAGQDAVFKVKVHAIKHKEVPPVDDELAKATGRFETLQELRQDLENRLQQAAEEAAQHAYEGRVIEAVVAGATVEPPPLLVERRTESMIQDLAERMRYQGVDLDAQLEHEGKTREDLASDFAESAKLSVKTDLVLEAVAKAVGLTVTDDEIKAEADRLARPYGKQAAEMRRFLLRENSAALRDSLLRQKAHQHLIERQTPVKAKPADETKAAAKPKKETKPKAEAKPKAETKAKAETKTKAKAETKPKAAAKPKAKASDESGEAKSE